MARSTAWSTLGLSIGLSPEPPSDGAGLLVYYYREETLHTRERTGCCSYVTRGVSLGERVDHHG